VDIAEVVAGGSAIIALLKSNVVVRGASAVFNYRSVRVAYIVAVAVGTLVLPVARAAHADDEQSVFASPEEAVAALINAVRSEGDDEIVRVLGPDGAEIAESGDPVADADRREKFSVAFNDANKLERAGETATLHIGHDEFPFPIPLVKAEGKWRWDTLAGLDEMLTRRIGENELAVIEVMRAYIDAQEEFASVDRDGSGPQYARRLLSNPGKMDGLYWPAAAGEQVSPLGPLVANAQREGYSASGDGSGAYHGYLYRILYSQGASADGGQKEYLVNGRMIGGFGLIATPAEYGNSGVMTFVVNDEGEIFETDLGPETARLSAEIYSFNPDNSWSKSREKGN